jgi:hypothetical protein
MAKIDEHALARNPAGDPTDAAKINQGRTAIPKATAIGRDSPRVCFRPVVAFR